ncbi:MAG TPA: hypothetical protein PK867_06070, partial [Pirellulales bacterium]|nr:hypothetical protein [Pirellulales bacterium]
GGIWALLLTVAASPRFTLWKVQVRERGYRHAGVVVEGMYFDAHRVSTDPVVEPQKYGKWTLQPGLVDVSVTV